MSNTLEDYRDFDIWFAKTQLLQETFRDTRHPNQIQYDENLRENMRWPHAMLSPGVDAFGAVTTRVLDVGCAYGTVSLGASLLGYDVTAVEILPELPNVHAFGSQNISLHIGNIEEPGVLSEVSNGKLFDIVIMTEVLEHLNFDPEDTLAALWAVTSECGRLVLSTPRYESGYHEPGIWQDAPAVRQYERRGGCDGGDWEWTDAHTRLYTSIEVRRMLTRSGWTVIGESSNLLGGMTYGVVAEKR